MRCKRLPDRYRPRVETHKQLIEKFDNRSLSEELIAVVPKSLVIVESPAKAKTIEGYLGSDYVVESSVGHIRDLPGKASQLPSAYKSEPWANLGVDVDNDFKAHYVVTERSKKQVAKLKKILKSVRDLN